jgi:hypothetical protein
MPVFLVILMDVLGVVGGIVSLVTNFMQIRQLRNERLINAAAYTIQRAYSRHRSTRLQVGSVTLERSYREDLVPQPPTACCPSAEAPSRKRSTPRVGLAFSRESASELVCR